MTGGSVTQSFAAAAAEQLWNC